MMKKLLSVLGNIVTVLILIVAVVMTVAVVTSTRNEKAKVPNLFGYAAMSVQTDSMESENGFYVGDLIIDRLLNEDEANNDLKVGDVITFTRTNYDNTIYLESHRIVDHVSNYDDYAESEVVDGIWKRGKNSYYTTRGDNTRDVDRVYGTDSVEYASAATIVGVWTGIRIPKLGAVMTFMQSSMGFMICIVIPVALFFIYQLYVFIMTLTRRQKEKAIAEVADKEAELKAKAVAEFLAQQQQNGGVPTPPAENTSPAAPVADGTPIPPTPQNTNDGAPAGDESPAPQEQKNPAEAPAQPAAPDISQVSEDEKQRIIQEYLAKQQQKTDGE